MECVGCACGRTDSREEKMSTTPGKAGKRKGMKWEKVRHGYDRAKKKTKQKRRDGFTFNVQV